MLEDCFMLLDIKYAWKIFELLWNLIYEIIIQIITELLTTFFDMMNTFMNPYLWSLHYDSGNMLNFKQDSTIINFLLFTTYINLSCWGSQNFIAELTSVGKKGSFDSNSAFCSSPSIAASSTKLISFQSFFIYEVIYFYLFKLWQECYFKKPEVFYTVSHFVGLVLRYVLRSSPFSTFS